MVRVMVSVDQQGDRVVCYRRDCIQLCAVSKLCRSGVNAAHSVFTNNETGVVDEPGSIGLHVTEDLWSHFLEKSGAKVAVKVI